MKIISKVVWISLVASCASPRPVPIIAQPTAAVVTPILRKAAIGAARGTVSPDGRFALVMSRDSEGISSYHFEATSTHKHLGETDISSRGYTDILWSPDSRSVAFVGNYSTSHGALRVHTLNPAGEFVRVSFDDPFPLELYEKEHGSRGAFMLPRDDADTIRWLTTSQVVLASITWDGGDPESWQWPSSWSLPVVAARFVLTIESTVGTVSETTLLGPMDYDTLKAELH